MLSTELHGKGYNYGNTALILAAENNQLDVVISFTALHWAVFNNHPAIVFQLLSDNKIDASLKDKMSSTKLR